MLTYIEKKYPSRFATDKIHLYGVGQIVPETVEWEKGTSVPVGDKKIGDAVKSAFQHSTFYTNVGMFINSEEMVI